jgi:sugar phosphate isomerase/epimerase
MRLSCLPVSLYADLAAGRMSLEAWIERAAGLGLDGADMSAAHLASASPSALETARVAATDAGIVIPILATYTDFTHPDAAARAAERDGLRHWIDVAARLGAPMLRVTAGQAHAGVGEAEGLAWAAEGLTSCLDDAAAAGVQLLFENHVRGAIWTLNDFAQPAARFLDIVRRTADTPLRILFDTGNNLALNEEPLAVLTAVRERLGAVHLSDLRTRGTFEHVRLGTGAAPVRQVLQTLVATGYDGWLSIEEASGAGAEAFEAAVRFADDTWIEAGGRPRRVALGP